MDPRAAGPPSGGQAPYAEFVPWQPRAGGAARLIYYVNYALYQGPSGLLDAAFFTHLDETHHFLERARRMDLCVCQVRLYADWLRAHGVESAVHVPMGFDYYRYRPRLVLGVIGRLDHPRKGRWLVERLRQLSFVEVVTTEGWISEASLRDVYQVVDYVLIPATVEGGPISLLEGLAMGKPVIAPEGVGMVPEFGASEHLCLYPAGDAEALVAVVRACYEEKLRRTRLVKNRTWDYWVRNHHDLFMRLLRTNGLATPEPAPGFRFGMLGELDIPPGVEVAPSGGGTRPGRDAPLPRPLSSGSLRAGRDVATLSLRPQAPVYHPPRQRPRYPWREPDISLVRTSGEKSMAIRAADSSNAPTDPTESN